MKASANFVVLGAAMLGTAYASGSGIQFVNVTHQAGINFVHHNGAQGKKYLPESLGSGCAFIDLDGDGWADILLLNDRDWTGTGKTYLPALYRNNHNGSFTDITRGSGLDVQLYAMGVAVADYDNDGLPDIYITALEGDRLFHNQGHGHFRDVTAVSGIKNVDFGTSAAWFDYDRDGKADLVVANYVQWSPQQDKPCSMDGKTRSYCTPEAYKGQSLKLYHNLGSGKFEDVTKRAGLADRTSKSLGITIFDYNGDDWPDIFVANDTQPNKLYRNNKNGTFTEEGVQAGVAYSEDGTARGGMGTDAADIDRSGHPGLLIGNFANQMMALYRNNGNGLFADTASAGPIGPVSLSSLTFGAFFFDYDLDGYPDIFAANGHLEPEIHKFQPNLQYAQPPLLFHNIKGRFENASNSVGPDFSHPIVGRGAAYADFDHDGDLDILINTNDGAPVLFRNDGGNENKWISVRLVGRKSNRSGLGAIVRVESASGNQWQAVHSGSSYCSQSDLALTFGLKQDSSVSKIKIAWPSGKAQEFANLPVNRFVTIDELAGLTE
ncbi:MAG: CRTAC1 family protein [Acidobacteriaceae bacterium]|nr:CRTAC1 family protein [Acidobacteriaceae bacterium]